MSSTIAIFPLNIVVFPGSNYPLHIFEERYKTLVSGCLLNKSGFGIVLQNKDEISKVGCMVEISEVTKKYADGKYDIVVHGLDRYYILSSFVHPDKYLLANIEPYYDSHVEIDVPLFNTIKGKFDSILNKINVTLEQAFYDNLDSAIYKSYKIAEKCGLKLEQQQELLTLKSENKRLYFLKDHLEHLDQYIDQNKIMKEIILGDGYIN